MAEAARAGCRVFLFDLDRTLFASRTVLRLSDAFGVREDVERIWDAHRSELAAGDEETKAIAGLFEGVRVDAFERVLGAVPWREGAAGVVADLKRLGFRVGVASAGYELATDRARRELGLDMSVGVPLIQTGGRLTGEVGEKRFSGACDRWVCKRAVLDEWMGCVGASFSVALGDGRNDVCMIEGADVGMAIKPCPRGLVQEADVVVSSLKEVPGVARDVLAKREREAQEGREGTLRGV